MNSSATPKFDRRRATKNGWWNVVQQFSTTGLNAVLGVLLVIFLPIEDVGYYNYALALSGLGATLMSAGLSGLAVKYFVLEGESSAELVWTIIITREIFALFGFAAIAGISLTSNSQTATIAAIVASTSIFARAFDAPDLWFLANLRSRVPAIIKIATAMLSFALKLIVLLTYPTLAALLILLVTEAILTSALILFRYIRVGPAPSLAKPSVTIFRRLLRDSWPLIVSGFANQLSAKAGIIVLQAQLGAGAVAVYATALRLTELTFLLPTIFMNSTLPLLLKARESGHDGDSAYRKMLQRSYDQAFWFGILVGFLTWIAGAALIVFAFGDEYSDAVRILAITALSTPFVFMATVYSKWIIAEGAYWLSLVRHGSGLLVSAVGSVLLIPPFGVQGAAWAWLAASVVSAYLSTFLGRRSRTAAVQMTYSFVAPIRLVKSRF